MPSGSNVAVPVKLDAFIFNRDVCDRHPEYPDKLNARVANINQPDYTLLRFQDQVLQSDLVPPVDVHNAQPSATNQRLTDVGRAAIRENRLGVYLHWIVPRPYRSWPSGGPSKPPPPSSIKAPPGRDPREGAAAAGGLSGQQFPEPPTRWLVIRKLDPNGPTTKPAGADIPELEAWVVESDLMRYIDEIKDPGLEAGGLPSVDLQVDVSPYINSSRAAAKAAAAIRVDEQAEIFIGGRTDAASWHETGDSKGTRAQLGLLGSSNPLFPDYQPHNSNVFSIVDRFQYRDKATGAQRCLTDAVADYYVVGWHWNPDDQDPFGKSWIGKGGNKTSRRDNLARWAMKLQTPKDGDDSIDNWLKAACEPVNVVCHGAMYGVEWHDEWNKSDPGQPKRPTKMPGDEFSTQLANKMPVAVGTTTMDAMLALIEASDGQRRIQKQIQDEDKGNDDPVDEGQLEADLRQLAALLRAQDDSAAAVQAGEDEVQSANFELLRGGTQWVLPPARDDDAGPVKPPPDDQRLKLRQLNAAQALWDAALRSYEVAQWDTFALWWRFVTDVDNNDGNGGHKRDDDYKQEAKALDQRRLKLSGVMNTQAKLVKSRMADLKQATGGSEPIASALPPFAQAKDPTVFIHGAKAGWPDDFLDNLRVRIDFQIPGWPPEPPPLATRTTTAGGSSDGDTKARTENWISRLPKDIRDTARALIAEFLSLSPKGDSAAVKPDDEDIKAATFPPLYHDQGGKPETVQPTDPWRDQWSHTQPWFPLFVEWEVEYFHLDYAECWALDEHTTRLQSQKKLRYAIADGVVLGDTKADKLDSRRVRGRVLLLPQANASLAGQLTQLFNSTPADILNDLVPQCRRNTLLANVGRLPFLSAPLDGMMAHLTTRLKGSHLKPSARVPPNDKTPDEGVTPIDAAWKLTGSGSARVGLGHQQVAEMGLQTDLTPYGSEVQPQAVAPGRHLHTPFKPVAHGQFRITKLNVVDKFGQVACALDPAPRPPHAEPPPFYPCLSGHLEPQTLEVSAGGSLPNTIVPLPPDAPPGSCTFAQLPPQLGQPTRLRACFVKADESKVSPPPTTPGEKMGDKEGYWRPIDDWDNPIWGWLVVNYVDNGVQFFTANGAFYREVRVTQTTAKSETDDNSSFGNDLGRGWLPLRPDKSAPSGQLSRLVKALHDDVDFLIGFMSMVSTATADVPMSVGKGAAAPSSYAQFKQSLLGRPLALVNVGVALELAADPLTNQSTAAGWTPREDDINSLSQYTLRFKLGDEARPYDGLVGYFPAKTTPLPGGDELDLLKLYTNYYVPKTENGDEASDPPEKPQFLPIQPINFPTLQPRWIAPRDYSEPGPDADNDGRFERQRNAAFAKTTFGCILDPFAPLHIYTAVQPVATLALPAWTWQDAMQRLTAFFHAGPLALPPANNVPEYDKNARLCDDYNLSPADADKTIQLDAASPFRFPGLRPSAGKGASGAGGPAWSWLQPYTRPDDDKKFDDDDDDDDDDPVFNAFTLGDPAAPVPVGLQRGPATMVEGYLQMRDPVQNTAAEKPNM